MDYKIERKKAFKVIANEKTFAYENAKKVIPDFWKEHYQTGKGKVVRGVYGINIDKQMGQENFDYLIAGSLSRTSYSRRLCVRNYS